MKVRSQDSRRGSALVLAIWIIAVLSLLVINFASEAQLQAGVNLYQRQRVHVNNLTEAGIAIAEVVMTGYADVTEAPTDETPEQLEEELEKDRWIVEKRALKQSAVTIGPIPVEIDETEMSGDTPVSLKDQTGGTVTITITSKEAKLNVNTLYEGGNSNYRAIWESILANANVPEDYWDDLICSWNDWRDEDSTVSHYDKGEGAESIYYKDELESEDGKTEFEPCKPRNGEIPDLKEMAKIRGFRDHPAVLTGGIINPEEKEEDQIEVKSILNVFDVIGSGKINVNTASKDVLMCIPGMSDEDGDEEIVNAIIEARQPAPRNEKGEIEGDEEDYGPFKDWNDLVQRTEAQIGNEAQEYIIYKPESYFEVVITGTSGGMSHTIKAVAMVEEKKVRYIRWQEDP